MSITHLKLVTWIAGIALGVYLAWFVRGFFLEREDLAAQITQEEQRKWLNAVEQPEPPRNDVVAYDSIMSTFHDMNWTGKLPPKPVEVVKNEGPKELPKTPVADLLKILLVQVDTDDGAGSLAYVSFVDPGLSAAALAPDDSILRIGDDLGGKYSHVVVDAIARDGVTFRFTDDEEREPETLRSLAFPAEASSLIVKVGEDGVLVPVSAPIPTSARPIDNRKIPDITILIAENHYLVGKSDREQWAQDYSKILAEVRYDRHRDPKTGEVNGIELKEVPEGSVAAGYGAKAGQVIKSINGHPVTSVNEAISYAKQNQDKYTKWTVVYEEQGKEYTKIIDTSGE